MTVEKKMFKKIRLKKYMFKKDNFRYFRYYICIKTAKEN